MVATQNIYQSTAVWTALVCPFDDHQRIDWSSLEKLIQSQMDGGIQGLVISGTTGEAPTLTTQEQHELIRFAKDQCGDRVKIVAGTGSNSTLEAIRLANMAEEAGAEGILVVTPPYNKPSLRGLVEHYEAISKNTSLPICLYHVPGRTAQLLTPEQIKILCEIPAIMAIKEASGNVNTNDRVLRLLPKGVVALTGDDPTMLPALSLGYQGVISVISNLYPKATVELARAYTSGQNERARSIHNALVVAMEHMFLEPNPCPIKYCLYKKQLIQSAEVRLPLVTIDAKTQSTLDLTLATTDEALEQLEIRS